MERVEVDEAGFADGKVVFWPEKMIATRFGVEGWRRETLENSEGPMMHATDGTLCCCVLPGDCPPCLSATTPETCSRTGGKVPTSRAKGSSG